MCKKACNASFSGEYIGWYRCTAAVEPCPCSTTAVDQRTSLSNCNPRSNMWTLKPHLASAWTFCASGSFGALF